MMITNFARAFLLSGSCCLAVTGYSQTTIMSAGDSSHSRPAIVAYHPVHVKKPKPISKELSGGVRVNTDGWGIFFDYGRVKSKETKFSDLFYNVQLFQLEFDEKKDGREIKSTASDQGNSNTSSYVYGKINNFYTLKLGYGFRKLIAGKPDPRTVSIHWVGLGGLSLGLLKPYYINSAAAGGPIKYTPATHDVFLDQNYVEGSAGFSKGLSETKMIPGVQLRTGLHFDFAHNKKMVLAAEAGISFEAYSQDIAIMALQKATPTFTSVYASFQFGKRW